MRDLLRRIWPTLGRADLVEGAVAFIILFLVVGIMPLHLRDVGRAVVNFVQAVWP
jgi:hypothetical protein